MVQSHIKKESFKLSREGVCLQNLNWELVPQEILHSVATKSFTEEAIGPLNNHEKSWLQRIIPSQSLVYDNFKKKKTLPSASAGFCAQCCANVGTLYC